MKIHAAFTRLRALMKTRAGRSAALMIGTMTAMMAAMVFVVFSNLSTIQTADRSLQHTADVEKAAADLLIIPTQAEFFSAYALRDMMNLVRRVRTEYNPNLAYRILITLLDQRNRAHRVIREQLQQTFGAGLFDTVIEIDTRLRESPIVGTPINQYKPNSRGSQQYRVLTQELIKYVQETNTQAA